MYPGAYRVCLPFWGLWDQALRPASVVEEGKLSAMQTPMPPQPVVKALLRRVVSVIRS